MPLVGAPAVCPHASVISVGPALSSVAFFLVFPRLLSSVCVCVCVCVCGKAGARAVGCGLGLWARARRANAAFICSVIYICFFLIGFLNHLARAAGKCFIYELFFL